MMRLTTVGKQLIDLFIIEYPLVVVDFYNEEVISTFNERAISVSVDAQPIQQAIEMTKKLLEVSGLCDSTRLN